MSAQSPKNTEKTVCDEALNESNSLYNSGVVKCFLSDQKFWCFLIQAGGFLFN